MSSPRAIAVVTAAMRQLIESRVGLCSDEHIEVTTLTPDFAASHSGATRLNLYLYHAAINPRWNNEVSPRNVPGDRRVRNMPPLPLNLYYLLTAYGKDNIDVEAHRVLGEAMAILHDHPILETGDILDVSKGLLKDAGLDRQLDRVRFTFLPLSLDDTFKIWSGFQCAYRMSVAYEASVVLIDSRLDEHHARPVLRRGSGDGGPLLSAAMPPRLDSIKYKARFRTDHGEISPAAAEIHSDGNIESLVLVGSNFTGEAVTVQFKPLAGGKNIERPAFAVPEGLRVTLPGKDPTPAAPQSGRPAPPVPIRWVPEMYSKEEMENNEKEGEKNWHPGFYSVCVVVDRVAMQPGEKKTAANSVVSNSLMVAIAPRVIGPVILKPAERPRVEDKLTLTCRIEPAALRTQRIIAIIGQRRVEASPWSDDSKPIEFGFSCPPAERGKQLLRIRVDDVENLAMAQGRDAATGAIVLSYDQSKVELE